MPKPKNLPTIIIVLVIFAIIILAFIFRQPNQILFYSNSCPHCQKVEEYINANGIRNKLKFRELEVATNQNNAQILLQKAQSCGLDTTQGVGIPVFFNGSKCLQGDTAIINYFEQQK